MTKIVEAMARTVVVPMEQRLAFPTRAVNQRRYRLVRVCDRDGAVGIGFCYAGNFGGTVASAARRDLIAPSVIGEERQWLKGLWEDLYGRLLLHGRSGIVIRALSALDIALWDRNARAVELPLWQYLGAVERESVPAYAASGGYYRHGKTAEDLAEETAGMSDAGSVP